MNKSNFDERIENLRKRTKFRLVNDAGDHQKYVNKSSFVSQKIFNKSFVAILEIRPVLTLGKPIHVGFSIFDLSKLLMYEFHYRYIKKKNIMLIYYLQTLIVWFMKLEKKMFMKIFIKIKVI